VVGPGVLLDHREPTQLVLKAVAAALSAVPTIRPMLPRLTPGPSTRP
jgi:hypothetical protein